MAYIKVDHSKFENAASSINTYEDNMKKKMSSASSEIINLSVTWKGNDFNQFRAQWNKQGESDSTYQNMRKSLDAYANFLRYAANQYKDAQANAVNRANELPREMMIDATTMSDGRRV